MAIFSSLYTGSYQTTASFGRVDIDDNVTAHSFTGIFSGALSSSAQIADDISGSFTLASSSFSTRITTEEANVDALQADSASFSTRTTNLEGRNVSSGMGITGGGNLSSDRTLSIDFSDSTFASGISGSFTADSASLSTRITSAEGSITTLQADSASFSTRVTN